MAKTNNGVATRWEAEGELNAWEAKDKGGPLRLGGYAIRWGSRSKVQPQLWGGGIIWTVPASAKVKTRSPLLGLIGHDYTKVLASSASGGVKLLRDGTGLKVEMELRDTTYARDLWELVRHGDVSGMSLGHLIKAWDYVGKQGGATIRAVAETLIGEVSITPIPLFPDTSAVTMAMSADGGYDMMQLRAQARQVEIMEMEMEMRS